MALTATIYTFSIQLSDVDRAVYEALELKAARHPSETAEHLIVRVLAWCLEYAEGIAFSRGISDPDQPALSVRDLTGALQVWIDIGSPDAARLHKAGKAAPRVVVYTHKNADLLVRQLAGEKIHRAAALEIYAFDREFIAKLVQRLDRRMKFDLSVSDKQLYLSFGDETLACELKRHDIAVP